MKTLNLLTTLGLVGALALSSVGCGNKKAKDPFEKSFKDNERINVEMQNGQKYQLEDIDGDREVDYIGPTERSEMARLFMPAYVTENYSQKSHLPIDGKYVKLMAPLQRWSASRLYQHAVLFNEGLNLKTNEQNSTGYKAIAGSGSDGSVMIENMSNVVFFGIRPVDMGKANRELGLTNYPTPASQGQKPEYPARTSESQLKFKLNAPNMEYVPVEAQPLR
jgi:hypothetical protein